MATIKRRGAGQFRVRIRRKGQPLQTRTFSTLQLAEAWARSTECRIDAGEVLPTQEAARITLGSALERYDREISPSKKGARQEKRRIVKWRAHPLAAKPLLHLAGTDLANYRDARAAGVAFERFITERAAGKKPKHIDGDPRPVGRDTIRLELAIISNLYTIARTEWGMTQVSNPVKNIRKPKPGAMRVRRLEGDEEARLLSSAGPVFRQVIALAVETAMRRGEIAGLRWDQVDLERRMIVLHDTKNGDNRKIPLSARAVLALRGLPRRSELVVGLTADGLTQAWGRAVKVANVKGMRFHDLRHEAISRMFDRGMQIQEVALISGHKTWSQLKRYTQLRAERLLAKLDQPVMLAA